MKEQMESCRRQLIAAGFREATQAPNSFYREDTALTAFFVNLKEQPGHICVYYGFASTAFTRMNCCENSLIEGGIREWDNCLRGYGEIHCESDAPALAEAAGACWRQYAGTEKDALLKRIKDRRKAFLDQITAVLKPLGFRKKGNQWRMALADGVFLQFWADKNPYADLYFFEVDIYSTKSSRGLWCYTHRLRQISQGKFRVKGKVLPSDEFDWQVQSGAELRRILDRAVTQYLLPIRNTPLLELGGRSWVWEGCMCPRDCCEACWVQKNLWEARQA